MVRWIRTAISAMEVARRVSPVVVLVVVPLYALLGGCFGYRGFGYSNVSRAHGLGVTRSRT